MTCSCRERQCGRTIVGGVNICAMADQLLEDTGMTCFCCEHQCGRTITGWRIDLGFHRNEPCHKIFFAQMRRQAQRRQFVLMR